MTPSSRPLRGERGALLRVGDVPVSFPLLFYLPQKINYPPLSSFSVRHAPDSANPEGIVSLSPGVGSIPREPTPGNMVKKVCYPEGVAALRRFMRIH
jgi:hypothetical protein